MLDWAVHKLKQDQADHHRLRRESKTGVEVLVVEKLAEEIKQNEEVDLAGIKE